MLELETDFLKDIFYFLWNTLLSLISFMKEHIVKLIVLIVICSFIVQGYYSLNIFFEPNRTTQTTGQLQITGPTQVSSNKQFQLHMTNLLVNTTYQVQFLTPQMIYFTQQTFRINKTTSYNPFITASNRYNINNTLHIGLYQPSKYAIVYFLNIPFTK